MADIAKRDQNYIPTLQGVSSVDGVSPVNVYVNPSTHEILVNASVSVTASDGAIVDGSNATIKASVLGYTNSNPLAVRLTDTNGDYIAAGAGTQYIEDAAAAADPIGTMGIMVRADSLSSITSADGDNIAFRGTNKGELYIKHVDAIAVTDNSGSITVDNSGTFATQSTLQTQTNTVMVGGVNIKEINAVTPLMGNGVTGNGALRVSVASDSTGQTTITDGTNTANVLKSDGTAAGQNSQMVAGTYQQIGSLSAGSLNADLVSSTDVSGYKMASLYISSNAYSGTLTFQGSNDNSNFVSVRGSTNSGSVVSATSATNTMFYFPLSYRYFRVRMTSYTSGTAQGTLQLYTLIAGNFIEANITNVPQVTGSRTNNTAAPSTTNIGALPALANAAQPTWTEGNLVTESVDLKGNQRIRISDAAGNDRGANVDSNNNLGVVLAAETTKVLGVIRTADGGGNLLTSNSTTFTSKFGLDSNLLGTLGTAFTTAGKVDIKGTDGDVFVRQTTASNLNATVVGTGTFATQSTLQTQTNTVMVGGINIKEINAVTPLMGNGVTGTGSLRVTIASDNTAFSVNAVQSGTWNIGTLTTLTGTTTLTPGVGATNLGKAENAVHASGDTGVFMLAVANEAQATLAADGDYIAHGTDTKGNSLVTGNIAHDGVAAGNPVRIAGKYTSSPAKVSASGDVVDLALTQEGKLLDIHSTVAADTTNINTNYASAQTNTSLQSAPGANKRIVIVEIIYSKDTAGNMKLVEDPAGTPATKFGPHYFPATGGMVASRVYIPLTANKALGITTVGGGNETISLRTIIENV